ncbi:type I toxin-antitoxin system SymE family toxin [Elizabethkingia ursingii]|uniref:SymE family type I addiction module toxin n=1 Tax=Elizabethkingia ursingii TaxID=1756150 RepID=UPI002010C9D2|nr:SymE family type I addiction module toxin [Elizabethkingia ursingii]MCL1665122.1 type I toxin-antitoxin system SymE family toxin [Elizabethkingia ursingii]
MNTKKNPLKKVNSKDKLLEIRRITVCRKILEKRNNFGGYNPLITLTGKWLWESGFRGGDKLALKVYKKRIIIEIEMSGEEFYKDTYDGFW